MPCAAASSTTWGNDSLRDGITEFRPCFKDSAARGKQALETLHQTHRLVHVTRVPSFQTSALDTNLVVLQ